MDKKTIIAVVGKSGSGKTSLCNYLRTKYGIPYIVSYTTRHMRDGESNGADHIFVTENDMPPKDQMLAYTNFGGNHYWALHIQVKNPVCYTIDEKGLIELKEKWSDRYNIVSVYIDRKECGVDKDRSDRDKDRVKIPKKDFDLVIKNNGKLDDFLELGSKNIIKLINKK